MYRVLVSAQEDGDMLKLGDGAYFPVEGSGEFSGQVIIRQASRDLLSLFKKLVLNGSNAGFIVVGPAGVGKVCLWQL